MRAASFGQHDLRGPPRPCMETSPPRRDRLSGQEITTACLARARLSRRAIADRLDLTARTVEHHLTGVYHKLGISSRGHLAFALA